MKLYKPVPLSYILFFIFLYVSPYLHEYLSTLSIPKRFPTLHVFINNPRPVHKKILIARPTALPPPFFPSLTSSLILKLPISKLSSFNMNQASVLRRSQSSKFFSLPARNWLGDSTLNKSYYRTHNLITLGTTPKTNISLPHHGCNKKNICTYFKTIKRTRYLSLMRVTILTKGVNVTIARDRVCERINN